jgi:hypothetical protein
VRIDGKHSWNLPVIKTLRLAQVQQDINIEMRLVYAATFVSETFPRFVL